MSIRLSQNGDVVDFCFILPQFIVLWDGTYTIDRAESCWRRYMKYKRIICACDVKVRSAWSRRCFVWGNAKYCWALYGQKIMPETQIRPVLASAHPLSLVLSSEYDLGINLSSCSYDLAIFFNWNNFKNRVVQQLTCGEVNFSSL